MAPVNRATATMPPDAIAKNRDRGFAGSSSFPVWAAEAVRLADDARPEALAVTAGNVHAGEFSEIGAVAGAVDGTAP